MQTSSEIQRSMWLLKPQKYNVLCQSYDLEMIVYHNKGDQGCIVQRPSPS